MWCVCVACEVALVVGEDGESGDGWGSGRRTEGGRG